MTDQELFDEVAAMRPLKYILAEDGRTAVALPQDAPSRHDSLMMWAKMFENGQKRRVAETRIGRAFWVSTVFFGLDHQWRDGPPVLFETMVFGGPACVAYSEARSCTWDEAEVVHAIVCASIVRVRARGRRLGRAGRHRNRERSFAWWQR